MTKYPALSVQFVTEDKAGTPINPSGEWSASNIVQTKWEIVGGSGALSTLHEDLSSYVRYNGGFTDYYEPFIGVGSANQDAKAVEVYFGTEVPLVDNVMWHIRARVKHNKGGEVFTFPHEAGYPRLWCYVLDGMGRRSNVGTTTHPVEVPWDQEWAWTWGGAHVGEGELDGSFGVPGEFDPSTGVYVYLIGAAGNGTIESAGTYTTYTYLEMEVESDGAIERTEGVEPFLVLSAYGSAYWAYDATGTFQWVATGNAPFWQGFPVAAWTTGEVTIFYYEGMHTLDGDHISYSYYANFLDKLEASGLAPVSMEAIRESFSAISAVNNYETNTTIIQATYWDEEFWDRWMLFEINYLGEITQLWDFGRTDVWDDEHVISNGDVIGNVLTFLGSDEGNIEGSAYYGYNISRIDLSQPSPTVQTLASDLYDLPQMYEPWSVAVNPEDGHIWLVTNSWGFSPDGTSATYSAELSFLRYDADGNFVDRYDFVDNTPEFAGYEVFKAGPGLFISGDLYIQTEGGWRPPEDDGWEGFGITKFDVSTLIPGDLSVADEDRPYNVMPKPWQWVDGTADDTGVLDGFDRANAASPVSFGTSLLSIGRLGSTESQEALTSLPWQYVNLQSVHTDWGIASGLARRFTRSGGSAPGDGSLGSGASVAYIDNSEADGQLRANISGSITGAGLIFRYINSANYWAYQPDFGLYNVVGGVTTVVSSVTGAAATFQVEMNGSSIKVYRNFAPVIEVTDATHVTATKHGLMGSVDSTRFEGFLWNYVEKESGDFQTGYTYGNQGYVVKPMTPYLPNLAGALKAGGRSFDM